MNFNEILFSTNHIKQPLTHQLSNGKTLSISDKKIPIIALSILFGAFTLGVGGIAFFYCLSAKYKIDSQKTDPFSTLPTEMIDQIFSHLSTSDLNNVAKVSKNGNVHANAQLIERAKHFGLEGENIEVQRADAYLSSLYKTVKKLAERDVLPDSKLAYRSSELTSSVDVEKTLENLKNLSLDELIFFYKEAKKYIVHKDDIQLFNTFLSNSNINEVKNITSTAYSEVLFDAAKAGDVGILKLLLEKGVNPNTVDNAGYTPLTWALCNDKNDIVSLLLQYNANPNARGNMPYPPLHLAIKKRNTNIIKSLLDKGANIDIKDNWGRSSLMYAVRLNRTKIVKLLLKKGVNPNTVDNVGDTPLSLALRKDKDNIVSLLLNSNPNLRVGKDMPRLILLYAIKKGDTKIVKSLLENIDIQDKSIEWSSLLCKAIECRRTEIVKLLLEKGVNPNAGSYYSPLMLSIIHRSNEIVSLLLKNNADPNGKGATSTTPLHEAVLNGRDDVVISLLEHGAEIDTPDEKGRTALLLALQLNKPAIAKLLLERGADPNSKGTNPRTPLHEAVLRGRIDVVASLLDHKANIDTPDAEGRTALSLAAELKKTEIVEMLLKKGANPNTSDKNGTTPVERAYSEDDKEILYLLLRYNAKVNTGTRKKKIVKEQQLPLYNYLS